MYEMEETGEIQFSGVRKHTLKKSFKLAMQNVKTSCSKEVFCKAFPSFSKAEQETLFCLYTQAVTYSLHKVLEEDFENLCNETQMETYLDRVERLLEEQSMDPLFSDKTNVEKVWSDLRTAKKNEIQHLTNMLESAEEQKRVIRTRVEQLKEQAP